MADDDFDFVPSAFSSRKKQKKSPDAELDELQQIIRQREQRAKTEARVKREEKEKDEETAVKQAFGEDADVEEQRISAAIGNQERLQAELLKADGPPPAGYFSFSPPCPVALLMSTIKRERILNGTYRTEIMPHDEEDNLSELFQLVWTADTENLSTAAFDSFVSLITGDVASFYTSRASVLPPTSRMVKWRLSTTALLAPTLDWSVSSGCQPFTNVQRGLRCVELLARYPLVDSPQTVLLEILAFSCFQKQSAVLTESAVRACARELLLSREQDGWEGLGQKIHDICRGRVRQNSQRPASTDTASTTTPTVAGDSVSEAARDEFLHRAVRIASLLSLASCPRSNQVVGEFFRSLADEQPFNGDTRSGKEISLTEVVKRLGSFLSNDVYEVHMLNRQNIRPHHFHRWHAIVRLLDLAAQSETTEEEDAKGELYAQLRNIQDSIDKHFVSAYTGLIDCIRFVKKQYEPYCQDIGLDGNPKLTQTTITSHFGGGGSTKKKAVDSD